MTGLRSITGAGRTSTSLLPLLVPYLPARDRPSNILANRAHPNRFRQSVPVNDPAARDAVPQQSKTKPVAVSPSRSTLQGHHVQVRRGSLSQHRSSEIALSRLSQNAIRSKLQEGCASGSVPEALQVAQDLLEAQRCAPSSSDIEQNANSRARFYSTTIRCLLVDPSELQISVAWTLLSQQHGEGLPIDPRALTMYLKAAVAQNQAEGSPMRVVASILPMLPEIYDIRLLTLILHTVIEHTHPDPEGIQQMITDCVSGVQGAGASADMREWDLELWDVYMTALLKGGHFREGIRLLSDFALAAKESQVRHTMLRTSGESISEIKPAAIARPYITLLSHWVETGFDTGDHSIRRQQSFARSRNRSNVPSSIAAHCLAALSRLEAPVELLNVWMNAELVAGNMEKAEKIWEVLSKRRIDGTLISNLSELRASHPVDAETTVSQPTGETGLPEIRRRAHLQPDATSYRTLFRLLKRKSQAPSRRLLKRFLAGDTDMRSLNTALSTIFGINQDSPTPENGLTRAASSTEVDLPAVMVLVDAVQMKHLTNDEGKPKVPEDIVRMVDVIAAGLLRMNKAGLGVFASDDPVFRDTTYEDMGFIPLRTSRNRFLGAESMWQENRTSLRAWDRLSRELHELREHDMNGLGGGELELLPVGRPLARLVDESSQESSSSRTHAISVSPNKGHHPTSADRAIQLLPALRCLLRSAIAHQAERSSEGGGMEVDKIVRQARREMGTIGRKRGA